MKIYLDSDIWLNYWLDEMLGYIPAGYYAERLLEEAVDGRWEIVGRNISSRRHKTGS